jgi:hypothetical protein
MERSDVALFSITIMNRKQLIETGVKMFQSSCFESSASKDKNGQIWWSGKTCEGGGAYIKHRMNQDTMTPVAVAFEVGHVRAVAEIKRIRAKAEEEANRAAASFYSMENAKAQPPA